MAVSHPKVRGKVCAYRQSFDLLDDYILSMIFEWVTDPVDRLSLRLVCKRFLMVQANSRHKMQVLRTHILPSALQRYTELKHLDLSHCHQVQDKDLGVVGVVSGQRLEHLNLSWAAGFTGQGLWSLATHCTFLKTLDLSNCQTLADEEIRVVAYMTNLEVLRLTNCRNISNVGLIDLARGCSKLRVLCLKSCLRISDCGVTALVDHCKSLEDLDLSHTEVTAVAFQRVAVLKNLKILSVAGCKKLYKCENSWAMGTGDSLTIWNMMARQYLNGVEVLKLADFTARMNELVSIGRASTSTSLRELSVSKCSGVSDEILDVVLKGCSRLERLDLTCCQEITDKTMGVIANCCKQLRSLNMESCCSVTEHGFAEIGVNCPFLEELNLTDCDITDQCLEKLANCKSLKVLKLAYCTKITDIGIQHIGAACRDLREIDLYRSTDVGDISIEALAIGCPNLSMLNVSYCSKLTDASLLAMARLPDLTTLEMRSLMKVTCDGVAALASGCRKLNHLDLKRCLGVMDWGMKAVAEHCLDLREICLSYCWMITEEGLGAVAKVPELKKMSLLHLEEVSTGSLEAALLGNGNISKVKISAHLKERFSENCLALLEERGCRIKWLDKPSLDALLHYPN